ncbi:nuclear pore complex protein Nup50-like isoform X2 [Tubulanus polymorphus]
MFAGFGSDNKFPSFSSSNGVETSSSSSFSKPASETKFTNFATSKSPPRAVAAEDSDKKSEKAKYLQKLRALNECVSTWIKQHVDKNPYCILTPIFKDYEKHLAQVELSNPEHGNKNGETASNAMPGEASKSGFQFTVTSNMTSRPSLSSNGASNANNSETKSDLKEKDVSRPFSFSSSSTADLSGSKFSFTGASSSTDTDKPKFSFTSSKANNDDSTAAAVKPFSFGPSSSSSDGNHKPKFSFTATSSASDSQNNDKPKFGFAASSSSDSDKPKFGFGSSVTTTTATDSTAVKPFSFAVNSVSSTAESTAANTTEEEYVPPEPETVEIKEDGAVYTKRCKLYYKSEEAWKEKGVGNVFLKVLEDGRTQFLIRAETTLGNVLLNIMLSKSIPFNRQGKNSVTFMCIPSPAIDPKQADKPYMMLLRVKTAEEADELIDKINEHKK